MYVFAKKLAGGATHHERAEDGDVAVGGDERVAVGVTERRVWRQVDEHLEILILQSIAEWATWPLSYEQFTGFY